jgi:hypothetical protein
MFAPFEMTAPMSVHSFHFFVPDVVCNFSGTPYVKEHCLVLIGLVPMNGANAVKVS